MAFKSRPTRFRCSRPRLCGAHQIDLISYQTITSYGNITRIPLPCIVLCLRSSYEYFDSTCVLFCYWIPRNLIYSKFTLFSLLRLTFQLCCAAIPPISLLNVLNGNNSKEKLPIWAQSHKKIGTVLQFRIALLKTSIWMRCYYETGFLLFSFDDERIGGDCDNNFVCKIRVKTRKGTEWSK